MATLYEFDLAGRTYTLVIANRHFYVLEDGRLLPVRVWPAWCECCQKFTAGEQILPIAEETQELSEAEYFAERPGHIPPDRRVPVGQAGTAAAKDLAAKPARARKVPSLRVDAGHLGLAGS